MTDEERQKLCDKLRWYSARLEKELACLMGPAADEIERLAEAVRFWQKEALTWAAAFAKARQRYEKAEEDYANANDMLTRERLELRVSDLERKAPW